MRAKSRLALSGADVGYAVPVTRNAARAGILAFIAALSVGCEPTSAKPPVDASVVDQATIERRLIGAWRIGYFRPDAPLGGALDAMLAFHQPIMVVRFENQRMRAESPGITFDRRYEVRGVEGDRFHLISYDETGTPQDAFCSFQPDGSLKVYMTSPWKGEGLLVRAASASP